jgi:hypothetical protein
MLMLPTERIFATVISVMTSSASTTDRSPVNASRQIVIRLVFMKLSVPVIVVALLS